MSSNTPNPPGDGFEQENSPPDRPRAEQPDPLANNPYSTQYQQTESPNLDSGAPELRSNDLRRMNRRALVFLAAIVCLLIILALFLFKSASNQKDQHKQNDETISVPDAPKAFPHSLPSLPEPIPVAAAPLPLQMPIPVREPPTPLQGPQEPKGPTLRDRRMMDSNGSDASAGQQPGGPAKPGGSLGGLAGAGTEAATSAQPLANADTLMLRGTFIRCVLETRIISDIPGFTSCVVTEPVYSFTGRRLLLPKGSKVLGKYDSGPEGTREAVIWDRVVTPNGIDVNMASPGVDNLGGSGHPGHLNSHWGSRIGAALLISMLSDAFKYEAAEHGPQNTSISNGVVTQEPFQSNTAQTLQDLSSQAVQASANRKPTLTINQGTVVNIYVAKDVDFSGVVARL